MRLGAGFGVREHLWEGEHYCGSQKVSKKAKFTSESSMAGRAEL